MKNNYLYMALFFTSAFALASYPAEPPAELASSIIQSNDADHNGMLSKDEVDFRFRVTRFDEVDKDKNGYLSHSELAESYANTERARQSRETEKENSIVNKVPIVRDIF